MSTGPARLVLHCRGVVQGVGFRPLVHRLAKELGLEGSVENGAGVVVVDLVGDQGALDRFRVRLPLELPAPARLDPLEPRWLPPPLEAAAPAGARMRGVRIAASEPRPLGIGLVAPALAADLAPCAACLAELADPTDRRHGYPFIACSACGPRYSIATAEPYARAHTTLAAFPLCPACRREFEDPADRRFHAETSSCPACGPTLSLLYGEGAVLAGKESAPSGTDLPEAPGVLIARASGLLEGGGVLALQGVGGFQLLVDACNPEAVARLRRRKRRPSKPFALLLASPTWIESHVLLDGQERAVLGCPAAPILLLRRRPADPEAFPGVAPSSPALGVMLPASPLHQLLAEAFGRPLVATSGNRSGEMLCIDPAEALDRLAGIADAFLVHNRAIARPLEDSVAQVIDGRPALLRRARGYAPQPLPLAAGQKSLAALALGGDLKGAPALALAGRIWLAPQLGDWADPRAALRLRRGVEDLLERHAEQIGVIACDAHPGYASHQLALHLGERCLLPCGPVQHHLAHGLAVVAEHGLQPPMLALCCDGMGYGMPMQPAEAKGDRVEETLWGGELLLIRGTTAPAERLFSLRPFPLPGGERAMREPRRAALGLLAAAQVPLDHPGAQCTYGAFSSEEQTLLLQAVASGCNSPLTSSVGRLFDAVSSLLGLCQKMSYEGEGGLRLQGAASQASEAPGAYRLPLVANRWDWGPLLNGLLADRAAGEPEAVCAMRFQRGLAEGLTGEVIQAARTHCVDVVVLAGGCFQNRSLLELTISGLRSHGLRVHWGEQVPCNDGGLAVGQLLVQAKETAQTLLKNP